MGIDRFIIMDHLSTDSTPTILNKLKNKGLDMHLLKQESPEYQQAKWATEMAKYAQELGTDWIICSDADEFWMPPSKLNLKNYLFNKNTTAIYGFWHNSLPLEPMNPFYLNCYFQKTISHKVVHKPSAKLEISMGNHDAHYTQDIFRDTHLKIFHFQHRDYKSLYTKFVLGAEALNQTSMYPWFYGAHWRDGLKSFKNGNFENFIKQFFYTEDKIKTINNSYKDEALKNILKGLDLCIG